MQDNYEAPKEKPQALTAENLSKHETMSQQSA
jgi:hypothetical protein